MQGAAALKKLLRVETSGRRPGRLFRRVPPSRQFLIEDLVDDEGELRSCILLGFASDGDHLISYTAAAGAASDGRGGHCLQIWSFAPPPARCRRLLSVPLFRVGAAADSEGEDDDWESEEPMLLAVCETPDRSLLVVHGSAPLHQGERRSFLTVLPGPLFWDAPRLQVLHLSYQTAPPHPRFAPHSLVVPLAQPPGAGRRAGAQAAACAGRWWAVGCEKASGLRFVHVAAERRTAAIQTAEQQAEASLAGGGSASAGSAEWDAYDLEVATTEVVQRTRDGARAGVAGSDLAALRFAPAGLEVDAEALAYAAAAAAGASASLAGLLAEAQPGARPVLRDYGMAPVARSSAADGREGTLLLVLLQLSPPGPRPATLSAVQLAHADAASGGAALLGPPFAHQELPTETRAHCELLLQDSRRMLLPMHGGLDPEWMLAWRARALADTLRGMKHGSHGPPGQETSPMLVLDNRSVLDVGESLPRLEHPQQPLVLLGFGAGEGVRGYHRF